MSLVEFINRTALEEVYREYTTLQKQCEHHALHGELSTAVALWEAMAKVAEDIHKLEGRVINNTKRRS